MVARLILAATFLLTHAPALADEGSAQVPEGSHFTLFALGVLGVIVGRCASKPRSEGSRDED